MKPSLIFLAAASVCLAGFAALQADEKAKPPAPAPVPKRPTYAEHVAPILNRHCVDCHRTGEVAPFSLANFESAKKWAPMIAMVTKARKMPPWKAVHGFGEFQGENRLTEDQIETLRRWSANETPRGDRKREPKPVPASSGWTLGEPDLVLTPSKPFKLSAEGADEYRNFVLKTNAKEPMWVTAMDVKPGNKRIVHHVIAFLDERGVSQRLADETKDGQEGYTTFGGPGFIPSGSLGGWAPGLRPTRTPGGIAFRVEPGSTIVMQVHYHRSGKAEEDQTKLGLYLSKEPVRQEMDLMWMANPLLRIPAGEKAHKVRMVRPVSRDVTIYAAMPHMHLLGRSMKAHVEFPDGTTKPIIHVADWEFNWQMNYVLKEPLRVPKGSKVVIEAVYDNSSDNPANPSNPPRQVTWGESTTDEMFLLVVAFTRDGETVQ